MNQINRHKKEKKQDKKYWIKKKFLKWCKCSILNFTQKNYILFDLTRRKRFMKKIQNFNQLKPSYFEINYINNLIDNIKEEHNKNKKSKIIQILPEFAETFKNMTKVNVKLNAKAKVIKKIITIFPNSESISWAKIQTQYKRWVNKTISRSGIRLILKNKLNFRYLKTTLKNPKLITNNYKLMCIMFIKIIMRALVEKFSFIFIDECGISLKNNNWRMWRQIDEQIYDESSYSNKTNLIMAVSHEKLIHFKYVDKSINSESYLEFIQELNNKIQDDDKKKTILILDNVAFHKVATCYQYYTSNNLNIVFCSPYKSEFNQIEWSFRYIKNITYKLLFKNWTKMKEKVTDIIQSVEFKKSLKYQYRETLEKYLVYINKFLNVNLNSLKDE